MLMRRRIAGVLGVFGSVIVAAALWSAGSVAAAATVAPGTPTARSFDGLPSVGPLFHDGLSQPHDCTASVVASPGRDLILTAAHCISGTGAGYRFVPGYDKGAAPYGVWTVTHAYVDPGWISVQDPRDDIAILQVAVQQRGSRTVSVQDVSGANYLLPRPRPGQSITAVAYNFGIDDQPITCTIPVYYTGGYPSFDCHGYVGGSSGSPWLTTVAGTHVTFVRGVTVGLHQGGCFEYTSYSAPLGADVYRLLARATVGDDPDTLPPAGSDGC